MASAVAAVVTAAMAVTAVVAVAAAVATALVSRFKDPAQIYFNERRQLLCICIFFIKRVEFNSLKPFKDNYNYI